MRFRYALLFVSDLDRSIAFYRDLIGLPFGGAERDSAEFDLGGVTLALHMAHVDRREHHHPPMLAGCVRLGCYVEHLGAIHRRLVAAGVPCLSGPETDHGVCVALYEDPDGFNVTLTETEPGACG